METVSVIVPCWWGEEQVPVSFIRLSRISVPESIIRKCAKLYCQIWQEPPWNEFFWKEDEVLKDMQREFAKPCAEGFIAAYERPLHYYEYENRHTLEVPDEPTKEKLTTVAGFTWGYPVSQQELRDIAGNNRLDFLFVNEQDRIFYVDELGVASEYRKRGIGKELSHLLLKASKTHGATIAILRTDVKAIAARKLYAEIGFKDLVVRDENHPERTYWALPLAQ